MTMVKKLHKKKKVTTFDVFNITIMVLFSLTILLPFYFVFTGTMVSQSEYFGSNGFVLWPEQPTFEAYKMFFSDTFGLWGGYLISILRVVIGTVLNVVATTALAYVLTKKWLPGRGIITGIVFIAINFSGGLIPSFLVVKGFGLYDSFWSMILPCLINGFYVLILRNFMMQIPESLTEAAEIDGAGEMRILTQVILPLSIPSIAVIAMFYAVYHWNTWFDASIYINNQALYPLQLILRKIIIQGDIQNSGMFAPSLGPGVIAKPSTYALKNTAILYTTLPILCVYPFVQKHFVKGMMIGAVKG